MPQNRWISFSVQFYNWSRAKILKCPTFSCLKILKCPIFLICFWKWNSSILGRLKNFKQILSHDKIICHMLFGAFQVTPRNTIRDNGHFGSQSYHDYLVIFISVKNYFKKPICSSRMHRQQSYQIEQSFSSSIFRNNRSFHLWIRAEILKLGWIHRILLFFTWIGFFEINGRMNFTIFINYTGIRSIIFQQNCHFQKIAQFRWNES